MDGRYQTASTFFPRAWPTTPETGGAFFQLRVWRRARRHVFSCAGTDRVGAKGRAGELIQRVAVGPSCQASVFSGSLPPVPYPPHADEEIQLFPGALRAAGRSARRSTIVHIARVAHRGL